MSQNMSQYLKSHKRMWEFSEKPQRSQYNKGV